MSISLEIVFFLGIRQLLLFDRNWGLSSWSRSKKPYKSEEYPSQSKSSLSVLLSAKTDNNESNEAVYEYKQKEKTNSFCSSLSDGFFEH
jgi:hypothetical protein